MAEERKLSSKKRAATAQGLDATEGMFTRSKSHMYLHRNRSGRVRFDSFPLPVSEKRRRTVLRQDSSNSVDGGDDLSCLIKDLRTKRVFPNGRSINSCSEPRKVEESSVEESPQSTPPDIDLFVGTKVVEENGNPNVGSVPEKQSNEINQKNSRIKSFLRPCSRDKLFKAQGSVSYRRLLPYLMDIAEDNSRGQKMVPEEKALLTSDGHENLINKSTTDIGPAEGNNLDSGSRSSSTPFECIKEPCKAQQFCDVLTSMVDEWSKPILKGGIEQFNLKNNSVLFSSCDTKLMDTGEMENIGVANPGNMNNLDCNESSVLEEKCNSGNDNGDGKCFADTKQSEIENVHKFDVGGSSEVCILNNGNSNLSDGELNECLSNAEQKDDQNGELLDQIDNANKDFTPRMLPDGDIFGMPETAENGGNKKCMNNEDDIPGKPLIGSRLRSSISANDKATGSSHRRKPVTDQLSQLKLFRTPGSVSYRRMLPFLKDVAEATSCASKKDHVLKLEKNLEANFPSPHLVSDYQEIPLGNPKGNDRHAERHIGHYNALPLSAADASLNDQEINSKLLKDVNEPPNPFNKRQEQDVHFELDISDTGRKLESGCEIMDINHEIILSGTKLCPYSTSASFWRKDDKQASSPPSSSCIEDDCSNPAIEVSNDAKPIEADSLHQKSSLRATFCLNASAPVFKRGILKRNPRGCRGLCTCLNCSSFRLHAEKAFEFSRNQMQDAEEVSLDLIKELSCMRNMLEKSPFSADGYALVSASQVKEVCRRAAEAEALAQNRLNEMNFELNIHCRITCTQGPRVRFANYVEEKVITKPDLPRKYSSLGKTKRKIMLTK